MRQLPKSLRYVAPEIDPEWYWARVELIADDLLAELAHAYPEVDAAVLAATMLDSVGTLCRAIGAVTLAGGALDRESASRLAEVALGIARENGVDV